MEDLQFAQNSHTIKILGTGCAKCKALIKITRELVAEHNIPAVVIKVEDMMEIMSYNVMTTPALVINEKVVSKGRMPIKDEVLKLIKEELNV